MKRKPFKIDENTRFEHLDNGYDVVRNSDDKVSEDTLKVTESEDNLNLDEVDTTTSFKNDIKDGKKFKLSKKLIVGGVAAVVVIGIIAGATSCASSNNKNNEEKDDENNITTEDTTENEVTTTLEEVVVTTEPEQTTIDENEDLKEFASINYITKDELVELFKAAEKELDGTSVTTEELAAFVVEINKSVINSDLRNILMQSGVISENEEINEKNYVNAVDIIRNNVKTTNCVEVDPELLEVPGYKELIEELKANSVNIKVSNMVSSKSKEKAIYVLSDTMIENLGNAKTMSDAINAYYPFYSYKESLDNKNMPNNFEENMGEYFYTDLAAEVSVKKFRFDVTKYNYSYDYVEQTECSKQKTLS